MSEVTSWIFQCKPEDYDLRAALTDLSEDVWLAKQRASDMAAGQKVYFWQSGPSGGLMAVGQIQTPPETMASPTWQLPYWRGDARAAAAIPVERVRVRYDQKFAAKPFTRRELCAIEALANQRPFAPVYMGTNFAVSLEAESALDELMSR